MPKVIKRLTEVEIKNAKPRDRDYKLYDDGGLRLLIRKSGSKVWQYPYSFHGKTNTYTIGKYCPNNRAGYIGTSEARKKRDEIKVLIEQGINPNIHKQAHHFTSNQKSQTTFEAIAREWHSKGIWVKKHANNILRCLESDVFPYIGYKQLDQVTATDIIALISKVDKRGAPDVAKRICQRCESIFDYGLMKGIWNDKLSKLGEKIEKAISLLENNTISQMIQPDLNEDEIQQFIELGNKIILKTNIMNHNYNKNYKEHNDDWGNLGYYKKYLTHCAKVYIGLSLNKFTISFSEGSKKGEWVERSSAAKFLREFHNMANNMLITINAKPFTDKNFKTVCEEIRKEYKENLSNNKTAEK